MSLARVLPAELLLHSSPDLNPSRAVVPAAGWRPGSGGTPSLPLAHPPPAAPRQPGKGKGVTVGVVVVPDLEELGGRDLHALQVRLRRHGGGAEGLSGGAVRGADCARCRSGDGGGGCGGDDSEGSSRRRPAEGYLWGWPGTATPPPALPSLSVGLGAASRPGRG